MTLEQKEEMIANVHQWEASGNNKFFVLDSWDQNKDGNSFPVSLYSKMREDQH
jgi:hypothetical protein